MRRFCLRQNPGQRLIFRGSWRSTALDTARTAAAADRLTLPPMPPPLSLPKPPIQSWQNLNLSTFLKDFSASVYGLVGLLFNVYTKIS